jgi:hypothetical protein
MLRYTTGGARGGGGRVHQNPTWSNPPSGWGCDPEVPQEPNSIPLNNILGLRTNENSIRRELKEII